MAILARPQSVVQPSDIPRDLRDPQISARDPVTFRGDSRDFPGDSRDPREDSRNAVPLREDSRDPCGGSRNLRDYRTREFQPVRRSHRWTVIAEPTPPAESDSEPAEFVPDSDDLAWDTGFTIGLEDGVFELPRDASPRAHLNFACGKLAGRRAREIAEARELGETMGYQEAAPEPPGGYSPREAAAFREGYAAGLARFEGEREYEAWLDTLAAERAKEIPGAGISDAEMWPGGVC